MNYWDYYFDEQLPKEGEPVLVHFADFTNLGSQIGIYLRREGGRHKVMFGNTIRYLQEGTPFYVYHNR